MQFRDSKLVINKTLTVVIWCCLSLPISSSRAKEISIPIGDVLELQPSFNITTRSTTNVLSEDESDRLDNDTEDDFVINISPGLKLVYPHERVSVALGYNFDIEKFVELSDEDTVNQGITLGIDYAHPSERFTLQLGQSYDKTRDAPTDVLRSDIRFNRRERTELTSSAGATVMLSPIVGLNLSVSRTTNEFDDTSLADENYIDDTYGIGLAFKIWTVTSWTLDYDLTKRRYPDVPSPVRGSSPAQTGIIARSDSVAHTISTGIARDITAKISGRARVGVTWEDFEVSRTGRSNEVTPSLDIDLTYAFRPRTSFGLFIGRQFQRASLGEQSSSIENTLRLTAAQQIGEKLTAHAETEYRESEFNSSDGSDEKYLIRSGISYAVNEWLSIGTSFAYEDNRSDVASREFRAKELFLTVGTSF